MLALLFFPEEGGSSFVQNASLPSTSQSSVANLYLTAVPPTNVQNKTNKQ
jgi:hypothetical protein